MRRALLALALLPLAAPAPAAPDWPPLPTTVESVLGPVSVKQVPNLHIGPEHLMGSWTSHSRTIRIRAGIHPAAAWQALFHEKCHMELWDGGVVVGDEALEDRICDAIGTARAREMRR